MPRVARRPASGVVLLHIDLDRFKQINDTLGHPAGDAMLIHTAQTIRAICAKAISSRRTGGDEFVIVCNADIGDGRFRRARATSSSRALRKPPLLRGPRMPLRHEHRHSRRLRRARSTASVCSSTPTSRSIAPRASAAIDSNSSPRRCRPRSSTTNRPPTASSAGLERGEFIPYFQPQFDARTFELVGRRSARPLAPSDARHRRAERIHRRSPRNSTSSARSTAPSSSRRSPQFRRWQASGFCVPRFSVNVSLRRLHDDGLLESLRDLDIEPGDAVLRARRIDLSRRTRRSLSRRPIDQIKALGIDIEIDDFGTGYASIVSLTKLKPRRLKIDRQLVTPIVRSEAQRRLVQSIVDIGKSLDIEIVAEGRGDDGACAAAPRPRLRHTAGLRFRQADGGRRA